MIRLRLNALPEDTATAVTLLAEVFEILEDCGDRAPRGGSALRLRYLTVRPRTDHGADDGPAPADGPTPRPAGTAPEIRALTVRQPWAAAIASGAKTVENRTWSTTYRGALAIHAAARADRGALALADDAVRGRLWAAYHAAPPPATWPGHIVALASLVDCHPAAGCCAPWSEQQPGVFHWVLADIRALGQPIACPGRLSLWRPGPEVLAALAGQVTDPRGEQR